MKIVWGPWKQNRAYSQTEIETEQKWGLASKSVKRDE